ncbi:uncharacterized protein LOC126323935 [Schistocerca gregaria]|uniref:uncharacterized protein LOC126323935 n=1 Tax=Schistocerca gregaria TaxID=7010 RepID=UPI00211E0D05|nr:uncharacterized protein LOC126323935 [Schistocerca gregaria]
MKVILFLCLLVLLLSQLVIARNVQTGFFAELVERFPRLMELPEDPYFPDRYCLAHGVGCSPNAEVRSFIIHNIDLDGELPYSINRLYLAEKIVISGCLISADLEAFSSMRSLKYLNLSNNKITGQIPVFNQQLLVLDLSGNNLSTLPPAFPFTLTQLKLQNNRLEGTLKRYEKVNFSNLTHFILSNNMLTGELPSCFGSFKKLQEFRDWLVLVKFINLSIANSIHTIQSDISNNNFSGEFPGTVLWLPVIRIMYEIISLASRHGFLRANSPNSELSM